MNPHEYLNSFTNFESKLHLLSGKEFDLSRIKELLDLLGQPQKNLKIIHVAGTKGKGSTCAFLSNVLARAGLRVGLYTSPHLYRLNERIRAFDARVLDNEGDFAGSITDEQLNQVVSALRPHIASMTNRGSFLTYFEVLTAAALHFFSGQSLDWVVLETGLGGRLDATNAADSLIAVITSISLDHTAILGNSLEKIAAEKSGIIKSSRQRAVIAPQTPEVLDIIVKRCREFGIPPIVVDPGKYEDVPISLKGAHQKANAATALTVVELLRQWGHKISEEAASKALASTHWPCRFELIGRQPDVIVDGAHNTSSMAALVQTLRAEYPTSKVIAVLGFSADKDVGGMAAQIKGQAGRIILTKADHPRSYTFDPQTAGALFKGCDWSIKQSMIEALDAAKSVASKNDVIVVAGSLFAAAQARSLCIN